MSSKINIVEPQVIPLDYLNPVKKIEYAYRTCYQSRHLMTDNSHKLITKLLYPESGGTPHSSPLEHVTVSMRVNVAAAGDYIKEWQARHDNYHMAVIKPDYWSVGLSGNLRAFFDFWQDYDPSLPKPLTFVMFATNEAICKHFDVFNPLPEITANRNYFFEGEHTEDFKVSRDTTSFNIITTRDILQELVRHRKASFSVESTRYCNYKTKGFTFVRPRPYDWCDTNNYQYKLWYQSCQDACDTYLKMLEQGARPEEARMVLPGGLKTELVMTADKKYWEYFLKLRDHETAHPQIRLIAKEIGRYV